MNNEQSDRFALSAEEIPSESAASGPDAGVEAVDARETLTGDEILTRMATTRLRLDEHADELVDQVRALSDWRSYVRRHPWLSVSAAAAIGFAIVPSRGKTEFEGTPQNAPGRATSPATEELRSVLIGVAKKAATAYASKSLGEFLNGFSDSNKKA